MPEAASRSTMRARMRSEVSAPDELAVLRALFLTALAAACGAAFLRDSFAVAAIGLPRRLAEVGGAAGMSTIQDLRTGAVAMRNF